MKKMNKKGFTIVELVIVIAVIAILAAVMIPTFSGIVEKAQKSAALQEARNTHAQYIADFDYTGDETMITDGYIKGGDYYFAVTDGKMSTEPSETTGSGSEITWSPDEE